MGRHGESGLLESAASAPRSVTPGLWLASLALAVAWSSLARANDGPGLSPRAALLALPSPPTQVEEARARWAGGVDRAVEPVRRGAKVRIAEARREIGWRDSFERDDGARRAAAARLAPGEVTALLAVEQARAAEPVVLSRSLEQLARSSRAEIEERAKAVEENRLRKAAACGDEACRKAAEREAKEARRGLLAQLLAQANARWELLKLRFDYYLGERQRLAERVATATSDPYVRLQAQGLLADAWRAVEELADEVEKETELAARLAQ